MSKNNKGSGMAKPNTLDETKTLSAKSYRSIVNIYIPDHMLDTCTDGYLVGYHFEDTHYVISSIVPTSAIDGFEKLSGLISST